MDQNFETKYYQGRSFLESFEDILFGTFRTSNSESRVCVKSPEILPALIFWNKHFGGTEVPCVFWPHNLFRWCRWINTFLPTGWKMNPTHCWPKNTMCPFGSTYSTRLLSSHLGCFSKVRLVCEIEPIHNMSLRSKEAAVINCGQLFRGKFGVVNFN